MGVGATLHHLDDAVVEGLEVDQEHALRHPILPRAQCFDELVCALAREVNLVNQDVDVRGQEAQQGALVGHHLVDVLASGLVQEAVEAQGLGRLELGQCLRNGFGDRAIRLCSLRPEAGVLIDGCNGWPGHCRIVLLETVLQLLRQAVEDGVHGLDVVGVPGLEGRGTFGKHGADRGAEVLSLGLQVSADGDGVAVLLALDALVVYGGGVAVLLVLAADDGDGFAHTGFGLFVPLDLQPGGIQP